MQVYVILLRTDTPALTNLNGHRATYDISRCQVFGVRCVPLHEPLTIGIGEEAALTARTLRDQHARAINSGRVKLHKFHVLQRQSRT